MAEYSYLYEEIDLSADLLPCEFCSEPFPASILVEHETGCRPDLFLGSEEPEVAPRPAAKVSPVPRIIPQNLSNVQNETVVLAPVVNENTTLKIEQFVKNDFFNIQLKGDGGCVLKRALDPDAKNESNEPYSYIHYRTNTHNQDMSESDEDDEQSSRIGSNQTKANSSSEKATARASHLSPEEMSDDDNDDNETVETFLLRASLQLNEIKRIQCRRQAEKKLCSCDQEKASYEHYQTQSNNFSQNCY